MAELATGAVNSLLGVIRNEAALLRGVKGDVHFIKEEMESMNSFLLHLARTAPPGEEHDEQVRTWMGQVRLLAHDCNNCLDMYLSRGNPDIHLPKKGPLRYLLWAHWYLQKMIAQHHAAGQLKTLKERTRDVGERRLRYSVKVPELEKQASARDKEQDGGDDQLVVATEIGRTGRAVFDRPRTLDDYFEEKLVRWVAQITERRPKEWIPSVSIIVEPDEGLDAGAIAHEALDIVRAAPVKDQHAGTIAPEALDVVHAGMENYFKQSVLVDIPSLHLEFMPLRPKEILYYILRELKLQDGGGTDCNQGDKQAADQPPYIVERRRKWSIFSDKKRLMEGVKRNIRAMKLEDKIKELKNQLEGGKSDRLLLRSLKKQMKDYDKDKRKEKISGKTLGVLLQLLFQSAKTAADEQAGEVKTQKDVPTLALWYDDIIEEATKKLQECMEKEEGSNDNSDDDDDDDSEEDDDDDSSEEDNKAGAGAGAGADNGRLIHLDPEQYSNILREVFPKTSNSGKRQQDQDEPTSDTSTLSERTQIQQIVEIEKEKLKLLQELLQARTSDNSKSSQAQEEDSLSTRKAANPTTDGDQDQNLQDSATVQMTIKEEEDVGSSNSKPLQAQEPDQAIPVLVEHQIKQIFEKVKVEILQELSPAETSKYLQAQEEGSSHVTIEKKEEDEGTSDSKSLQAQEQDSSVAGQFTDPPITQGEDQSKNKNNKNKNRRKLDVQEKKLDATVQETKVKIEEVKQKIKEQLKIRRIMDKIKDTLNNKRAAVILKINDQMIPEFPWEETRNALRFLDCIAGAVIVTSPCDSQQEYCYPEEQEPINYSLVGLYHDDVLKRTSQKKHQKIIHDILEKCKPDEFCMKIFAHALYANPKRHIEDLNKLHNTLQKVSQTSLASIAKKVFKFSYNDLPDKEYKSCLLYLAIFPPEYKIRRSTLIGRWVAEGLITTEDWIWSNSVCKAEKCFDTLIRRLFVHPVDFDAAGEVKSCMVTNIIHGFITNIAEKQRIIEARLSHHLAHHFSIYNDLRLRGSDKITDFFKKLSKSSPLIKVLDLQGCQCFSGKNIWFLKQICRKILLLKYLSIRGTNATQLPIDINNLQELEVLDIRQTQVPAKATRHIRLLKLKRLLAGNTDPSLSSTDIASVQVPEKVENMAHMEVLSKVKPMSRQDLEDIGTLTELRKLGMVIEDKDSHLRELFSVISNLHKYLRSLSITLHSPIKRKGTPYSRGYSCLLNATKRRLSRTKADYHSLLKDPPKLLESLSISGTTQNVQLLQELLDKGVKELVKVTLSNTLLEQKDLKVLAMLPKLQCFRLQHISCPKTKLTFNEDEFPMLKYFVFEGSSMTDISFEAGATHGLDEIVLSFNIDAPNTTAAATTTGNLPKPEEHGSNNKTDTNTIATTAATGVDGLPTQESNNNNNTIATTNTTTKVNSHPKQQQESNNNDTAAAANTATEVDSLTKLAEQKSNNIATTTTGVNGLPKQEHELHTTTTTSSSSRNSMLLSLFDNNNAKHIAKVTLRGTQLKEADIRNLAKKPKLRCLVLLERSYDESKLTFNKDEFPKLNILKVNCSNIEKISFTSRSAPRLEKIIWTFTNSGTDYSLSGISNLPKLKDFKFNGDAVPHQVQEALDKHGIKPFPEKNELGNEEQEIEKTEEEDDACFPFCWKNQV